jgi:hypothetical protein
MNGGNMRRLVSAFILFGLLVLGLAQNDADVTITIESQGASAYFVTMVEGADNVTELNENNSAWTLEIGRRYRIINSSGSAHPFALRAGNDMLLSQDGSGSFVDDPDVDFVTDDEGITFTLTEALAEQLDNYVCTLHPAMTGEITSVMND